jgi:hypothetical protein
VIQKAVYSHWSKPNNNSFCGFRSSQAFANSLRLSLIFARKWFKETELITDKKGYDLLIKKHKFRFDNVRVCLDKINHVKSKHWSIGKLVACSLQDEPFMHIDNDVFWFKKPKRHLLMAEACFQNKEDPNRRWYMLQRKAAELSCPIKEIDYTGSKAYNCGFIGFNKLDIINKWLELAFDYIEWFDKGGQLQGELSSLMFEQYPLPQLLEKEKYKVEIIGGTVQLKDWDANEVQRETWQANTDMAVKYGYTHLIAGSKRTRETEEKVLSRLYTECG